MSEYRTIKGKRHYVYEVDEFEGEYLDNWREGDTGDWVLSDDNRIVQILKRGPLSHPNNRKNYTNNTHYVRTVVGTFVVKDKFKMDTDFDSHPNRYSISKKDIKPAERVKVRETITRQEREFVTQVVLGAGGIKAAMTAYGISDLAKAKQKSVILFKQERIMNEIKKSVADVLEKKGINDEYIIDGLIALFSQTSDLKVALSSLKELGKLTKTLATDNPKLPSGVGAVGLFQGFGNMEQKQIEE